MSSHHRGHMSKHPARVKIAILEFIEARLKDVVDYLFTVTDKNKYENVVKWLIDYMESPPPKPTVNMTWLRDNYMEFGTEDLKTVISATIAATSDANMKVKVYDPFTTENDFYLILDFHWDDYLRIYGLYYNPNFKGWREVIWENEYDDDIKNQVYGGDDVFNASTSKTEIFYTIQQMKNILDYGTPRRST